MGQWKAHCSPQQPSDKKIGTCTFQTTRDNAEDQCTLFSLCFIIEIYGEVKESWLHRSKITLQSRFVSLRSRWKLTALTVNVQIIMLSFSVSEYSSYVVCVKRMRLGEEMIFNLQLQTQWKTRLSKFPPANN